MTTSISVEEFYAELRRLETAQPEGSTIAEMAAATGWPRCRVINLLRIAKQEGRLVVAEQRRETLAGKMAPVPVYRILPAGGN